MCRHIHYKCKSIGAPGTLVDGGRSPVETVQVIMSGVVQTVELDFLNDIVGREDVKHHLLMFNQVIDIVQATGEGHCNTILGAVINTSAIIIDSLVAGNRNGSLACPYRDGHDESHHHD